jgi:hypothetical protein
MGGGVEMIDVRSQTIFLDEDGIVHATLKPMVELNLADAEEAVEAIRTLSGERRRPVLVDLRKAKGMSREARVYFSGPVTATVGVGRGPGGDVAAHAHDRQLLHGPEQAALSDPHVQHGRGRGGVAANVRLSRSRLVAGPPEAG